MSEDKISSGIRQLDELIDSFHIGDNVIWEVVAGTSHQLFMRSFLSKALEDGRNILYVSFNHSPQSIFNRFGKAISGKFVLLDCFTSGKGKDDHTFTRFYANDAPKNVIRISRPSDIEHFTQRLNEIEDSLPTGACYIFDSLTGMQDLWGSEEKTYKFFTYMCPRLYDLETVAYWIMEKEAHSSNFKANLRHVTQVVLELSKRNENLFIKAHKLDSRLEREAFKAQQYQVVEDRVVLLPPQKDVVSNLDIGSRVRKYRTVAGLSQKDLADKIGLTASSISQLENNQISLTINNFILICKALNVSLSDFWLDTKEPSWIIRKRNLHFNDRQPLFSREHAEASIIALAPGGNLNEKNNKNESFIYVLRGNVSVSLGSETHVLTDGDAAMMLSGQSSVWKNVGSTSVTLLRIGIYTQIS